ncbi:nucleotide sugar dehydrogenase [Haladaptatus pallidirubidus]|uniref:UDP-N-acetyl-D-mannosamine dehydrogenase n=1 Tax=Haladaptatus pallidirubidus TaxID=1008152 RepID=A0AAV3UD82_9EURY|nr:nucleotide sugar dehydrogenase [Haladaptatus pallidirubidus]
MSLREAQTLYGSDSPADDQREAFRSGNVPVAVYGLGKMGLPLAAVYAETCGNVVGADIDPDVVAAINRGDCHVKREPGLDELVSETVEAGALLAVESPTRAAHEAAVHVVIVPTPITDSNEPDLAILQSVAESIAEGLEPGDLVVVECTVPPGTTRDELLPLLERESDLSREEFGVAVCPERTSSGRALEDIRGAYPKVVGGVDDESTRVAELVYGELTDNEVISVPNATTAEAVKVFEGVYRDVNIALANELAVIADDAGISVNGTIETANTQPFCHLHKPGPGVGGHCIPYYPYFLIEQFDADFPLLRTAREVNDSMPAFTVEKTAELLAEERKSVSDSRVLVLGLTYRSGVEETRATPAGPICADLTERGADVFAVDPMLDDASGFDATLVALESLAEREFDAVVLVTDHDEFAGIDWAGFDPMVVVDGRNALDLSWTDHRVYTIGGD